MAQVEKDALTGTDTTGHSWDGIKELNTPLPRWWLYTFYACVIWAVGYWVVYPAWPTLSDYSKGVIGYSSRGALMNELEAVKQSRSGWLGRFETASVEEIAADNELRQYAMSGGKFIFNENCAPCHGAGGQGAPGFPILADDDWTWGGTLADIEQTIRYGIRSDHDEARLSEMPAYGRDQILERGEIEAVAEYVAAGLSGSALGETVFAENCAACHGEDGRGMQELGAPNLVNGIWLYEGGKAGILTQLNNPRHGVMPAWEGRLDSVSIKQAAVYVHTLGGGR